MKIFTLILALICSGTISAQSEDKENIRYKRQYLKIEPINFILGQFPVVYEYHINYKFSIEAIGGFTHLNPFYNQPGWFSSASDLGPKASLGYILGAAFRYYYLQETYNEVLDGFYVGLEYRKFNFNSLEIVTIRNREEAIKIKRDNQDIKLTLGVKSPLSKKQRFVNIDAYVGLGGRYVNMNKIIEIPGTVRIFAIARQKYIELLFDFEVRLGVNF